MCVPCNQGGSLRNLVERSLAKIAESAAGPALVRRRRMSGVGFNLVYPKETSVPSWLRMRIRNLQVVCFGLLAFARVANAELQQWTQRGVVTFYDRLFWNSSVTEGTPFEANIVFETSTPPSHPNDVSEAQYRGAAVSVTLTFGNYTFDFTTQTPGLPSRIDVRDGYNGNDAYGWLYNTPVAQHGLNTPFVWGMLLSSDLSLIDSVALDINEFDVSVFDVQRNVSFSGRDPMNEIIGIDFEVTGYTVTAIPEPSSGILLAFLFAVFAALYRHR